jgi:hypothetical protein
MNDQRSLNIGSRDYRANRCLPKRRDEFRLLDDPCAMFGDHSADRFDND